MPPWVGPSCQFVTELIGHAIEGDHGYSRCAADRIRAGRSVPDREGARAGWFRDHVSLHRGDSTQIVIEKANETDVFLSYHHDDREMIEQLAMSMRAQGWRVFWDRTVLPGDRWERVIESCIESAKCVVVIWSSRSKDSDWVREEAYFGKERGNLVPACIDGVTPPFGFKSLQAADLSSWDGSVSGREFQMLLAGVRRHVDARR